MIMPVFDTAAIERPAGLLLEKPSSGRATRSPS